MNYEHSYMTLGGHIFPVLLVRCLGVELLGQTVTAEQFEELPDFLFSTAAVSFSSPPAV